MTQKQKTRRAGGRGRALELSCLATRQPENSPSALHLQALFIARRFGLAPARAALVAELAFSTGAIK